MNSPLLEVKNLKKTFPVRTGFFLRQTGEVKAVDDVSFVIHPGETLGLVGESGCGKSTLGRSIIRLYEPDSGEVKFQGEDFLAHAGARLRQARRNMQMIFQDPAAALNPRMTVGQILAEPYKVHRLIGSGERQTKVRQLLSTVGLQSSDVNRYPHEFSGGQKQRICIARTLALEPRLIVADEPVSALDVSIQAQILNLLKDLQEKFRLTYLFISHDLSVIAHVCDRVAVMYLGKIVELATRDELFANPKHPYTKALIQAIPRIGDGKLVIKKSLSGEVPSPLAPPKGCAFHPRCPQKMDRCSRDIPILAAAPGIPNEHQCSCWLLDKEVPK
ncbi:MAG: peptide ABC transporter ATP-binding protein [Bdellovibrio sp.]|nr:MAG: peptide ABC transporter ATP-binding protein [Bdellovibrio sp.]